MPDLLTAGPVDAAATLVLAHGAGGGMNTPFMSRMTELLVERQVRVVRFVFGYMATRAAGQRRSVPPRAERLTDEYRAAIDAVGAPPGATFAIGGKSMGGRVASLIADEMHAADRIKACVCLGYPFHPPSRPEQLRTAHLEQLRCPALIIQGERDPFGSAAEVAHYRLSPAISVRWARDGDHDLGPRGASGYTRRENLAKAADAIAAFLQKI